MFIHHKELLYPVEVKDPDARASVNSFWSSSAVRPAS